MKNILLFSALFFSSVIANAQTFAWAGSLGSGSNEEGRGVAVDANGNVYSIGYFTGSGDFDPGIGVTTLTSAGSSDVYVSKLDAAGNFVWAFRLGGTGPQSGASIALDNSGNIYITGNFNNTIDMDPGAGVANITSLGAQDIFIGKYDASGNHVWSKRFGSAFHEASADITVDASGNVLTCGLFTGTTDFDPGAGTVNLTAGTASDGYISKLDANGDYVWVKQIGLNGSNTISSIVCDAADNIYLAGYYEGMADFDPGAGSYPITSAGVTDAFFVKLLSNGDFSWAGSMGGTAGDYGRSVAIDSQGNIVVTGEFQGTADLDPTAGVSNHTSAGVKDIFVSKFSPANFIWAVRAGDTNNEIGYSITTDANNNIYLTGDFIGTVDFDPGAGSVSLSSNGNQRDCFIWKLDASGNYMWAGVFGSASLGDDAFSICVDANTHIYTTGYYQDIVDFDPGVGTTILTSGGQFDAYVLKIEQCSAPAAPTNTTTPASLIVCGGGSTTLTASGSGILGWYSDSTGGTYLGGGSSFTTPVLSNDTVFYVQDSTCMNGPRTAVNVTFNPAMSASASSQTNVTCFGGSDGNAGVSVSGGTPNYSYLWTPSGGTSPVEFNMSAGTYTCTVTDAAGCTTAQIVTITEPAAIDVTTTLNGNMLSANQNGATYQWIDCLNSNSPVAGETNQTFTPQVNGDYAVIVMVGPCSDTSACTNVITGIESNQTVSFGVFPNPTNGIISIQLKQSSTNGMIEVFNATGQLVRTEKTVSSSVTLTLPDENGIYLIRITVDGISTTQKIIKE